MKKYFLYTLFFFCTIVIVLNVNVVDASLPLMGKVIVIDPGHGGVDVGCIYEDIYEKDINLNISKYLEIELIKLGASVYMTRSGDYDLSTPDTTRRKLSDFNNRIKYINEIKPDVYLSIHMNYLNESKYKGSQIFYRDDKKIAKIIQDNLNKEFKFGRSIKEIPSHTYMYNKLKFNGVLVECGFLSNYEDRLNFSDSDYVKKYVKVLANSLVEYFF